MCETSHDYKYQFVQTLLGKQFNELFHSKHIFLYIYVKAPTTRSGAGLKGRGGAADLPNFSHSSVTYILFV
ncbi:hypothetical protein Hanom_Chr09g00829931 [Helianthus anomalus]